MDDADEKRQRRSNEELGRNHRNESEQQKERRVSVNEFKEAERGLGKISR